MKKAIVVILSILYFTISSGATVRVQYCMGKLVDISIGTDDLDDCDHCGMKKDACRKKCCKEEHKVFKSSDQHASGHVDLLHNARYTAILPVRFHMARADALHGHEGLPVYAAHAPPIVRRTCPIYLRIRNFRI